MTADEPHEHDEERGDGADVDVERFAPVLRDEAVWAEPPVDLLDRILAERADGAQPAPGPVTPFSPSTPSTPFTPSTQERRRSWVTTIAAVAAVSVALFAAGFLVGVARDDDPPAAADDEVVATVALVGTELAPAARAAVDVLDRGAGYALILRTEGLEPAPSGEYYEGWLSSADDVAVSIGTFHMRGGDGTVVLWSGVAVADFPLLTVRRHAAGVTDDVVVMTGTFAPE